MVLGEVFDFIKKLPFLRMFLMIKIGFNLLFLFLKERLTFHLRNTKFYKANGKY